MFLKHNIKTLFSFNIMELLIEPEIKTSCGQLFYYESVLSDGLLEECIDYVNYCIDNNNYCTTNKKKWYTFLHQDSNKIYVIYLNNRNIELYNRICVELKNKLNMITDDLKLNINIMDDGCNIGEHCDGHVNYALTIYLSNDWKEEYGGLLGFRKEKDEELKYICPKFNSMILLSSINHIVTNVNVNMKRISIQGFYTTRICYKNKDINLYLNNIKNGRCSNFKIKSS